MLRQIWPDSRDPRVRRVWAEGQTLVVIGTAAGIAKIKSLFACGHGLRNRPEELIHVVPLRYARASDVVRDMRVLLRQSNRLVADGATNSVIVLGFNARDLKRLKARLKNRDRPK